MNSQQSEVFKKYNSMSERQRKKIRSLLSEELSDKLLSLELRDRQEKMRPQELRIKMSSIFSRRFAKECFNYLSDQEIKNGKYGLEFVERILDETEKTMTCDTAAGS